MFNIGWPELFIVAAVALVAIGPQQLPEAMHKLGRMAGRFKAMRNTWRSALDRLAYEADLGLEDKPGRKPKPDQDSAPKPPDGA
ncbi:MAG: hypothetical protein GC131_01380 [Alphaproteobacteria bacterium]|nr:hypothetical protein [Alphaproteobacteria bacterium]